MMRIKFKKGQIFGSLITTGKTEIQRFKEHLSRRVEVTCKHGNSRFVSGGNLTHGTMRSCRRWKECFKIDFKEGREFGSLITTGKVKIKQGTRYVEVVCKHGNSNFILKHALISGKTKSCKQWKKCPKFSRKPEYSTVISHIYYINNEHSSYKGMPCYDEWNPKKGGSYEAGYNWIVENLGKRPKGRTLDIIKHEKGFVPGNLRWAPPKRQTTNKMFKRIADLETQNQNLVELLKESIELVKVRKQKALLEEKFRALSLH